MRHKGEEDEKERREKEKVFFLFQPPHETLISASASPSAPGLPLLPLLLPLAAPARSGALPHLQSGSPGEGGVEKL